MSKVRTMAHMFRDASAFDQDLSASNVSSVTNVNLMFSNSGMSEINLNRTIDSWMEQWAKRNSALPTGVGSLR